MQKFWEVDSSGSITERELLKKEEAEAIKAFESSVQFKGERYEVDMPWKPNARELPNKYEMAVNRLISTEKRLLKDPQLAGLYYTPSQMHQGMHMVQQLTLGTSTRVVQYLPA